MEDLSPKPKYKLLLGEHEKIAYDLLAAFNKKLEETGLNATSITRNEKLKLALAALSDEAAFRQLLEKANIPSENVSAGFVHSTTSTHGGELVDSRTSRIKLIKFLYDSVTEALAKEKEIAQQFGEPLSTPLQQFQLFSWLKTQQQNQHFFDPSQETKSQILRQPLIDSYPSKDTAVNTKPDHTILSSAISEFNSICTEGRCIPIAKDFLSKNIIDQQYFKSFVDALSQLRNKFDVTNPASIDNFCESFLNLTKDFTETVTENARKQGLISSSEKIDLSNELFTNYLAVIILAKNGHSFFENVKNAKSESEVNQLVDNFRAIATDLHSSNNVYEVVKKAKRYNLNLPSPQTRFFSFYFPFILSEAISFENILGQQLVFQNFYAYNLLINNKKAEKETLDILKRESSTYAAILFSSAFSFLFKSGEADTNERTLKKLEQEKEIIEKTISEKYGQNDPLYLYLSSLSPAQFLEASAYAFSSTLPTILENSKRIDELISTGERPSVLTTGVDEAKKGGGAAPIKIAPLQNHAITEPPVSSIKFEMDNSSLPQNFGAALPLIQSYLNAQQPVEPPALLYFQKEDGVLYSIAQIKTAFSERYFIFEITPKGQLNNAVEIEPTSLVL
ncbi:MAG: hypothetical protein QXW70_04105 [Candidatus Anstonellales archaeon]